MKSPDRLFGALANLFPDREKTDTAIFQEVKQLLSPPLRPLPGDLLRSIRHATGATAAMYALLLEADGPTRERQLNRLRYYGTRSAAPLAIHVEPLLRSLDQPGRVAVIDATVPALQSMPRFEYRRFIDNLMSLAQADSTLTVFEYLLITIMERTLEDRDRSQLGGPRYTTIDDFGSHIRILLSGIAYQSAKSTAEATASFHKSASLLDLKAQILQPDQCTVERVSWAVKGLRSAPIQLRLDCVRTCLSTLKANGELSLNGTHLLRAVCEALHCFPNDNSPAEDHCG